MSMCKIQLWWFFKCNIFPCYSVDSAKGSMSQKYAYVSPSLCSLCLMLTGSTLFPNATEHLKIKFLTWRSFCENASLRGLLWIVATMGTNSVHRLWFCHVMHFTDAPIVPSTSSMSVSVPNLSSAKDVVSTLAESLPSLRRHSRGSVGSSCSVLSNRSNTLQSTFVRFPALASTLSDRKFSSDIVTRPILFKN